MFHFVYDSIDLNPQNFIFGSLTSAYDLQDPKYEKYQLCLLVCTLNFYIFAIFSQNCICLFLLPTPSTPKSRRAVGAYMLEEPLVRHCYGCICLSGVAYGGVDGTICTPSCSVYHNVHVCITCVFTCVCHKMHVWCWYHWCMQLWLQLQHV